MRAIIGDACTCEFPESARGLENALSNLQQRTLVIVKPDGASRGLVGEILARFERKGFRIVGMKLVQVSQELAKTHYAEHKEKPFYGRLVDFITSGPAVVVALEGREATEVVRGLVGPTSGLKAPPGTIRGDYALSMQNNLIHASDSPESAERELALWFSEDELVAPGEGTGSAGFSWVYGDEDREE